MHVLLNLLECLFFSVTSNQHNIIKELDPCSTGYQDDKFHSIKEREMLKGRCLSYKQVYSLLYVHVIEVERIRVRRPENSQVLSQPAGDLR